MNLFRKKIKKAFTLIELVVVIAVIATLAALSIITYVSVTTKAKKSNDTQLIDYVNTSLTAHEILPDEGKPEYMQEAMDAVLSDGFVVNKLLDTTYKDYEFVYNAKINRFGILEEEKDLVYPKGIDDMDSWTDIWRFASNNSDLDYSIHNYSYYLLDGCTGDLGTVKGGIDVGTNNTITNINYENNSGAQNVIIRTLSGSLTVNGPKDTVTHYGFATLVTVDDVNNTYCYDEKGVVAKLVYKDDNGKINIKENATIFCYENASNDSRADKDNLNIPSSSKIVNMDVEGDVNEPLTCDKHATPDYYEKHVEGEYTYCVCKYCGAYVCYNHDGFVKDMSTDGVGPGEENAFILVPVQAIYIRALVTQLDVGDTCVIGANLYPAEPSIPTLVWESSDPTIASVTPNSDGSSCTVTALKTKPNGARVNIIARATDGSAVYASYTLDIVRNPLRPYVMGDFVVQSGDNDVTIEVLGFTDAKLAEIAEDPSKGAIVILPENVDRINQYAFAGLEFIKEVKLNSDLVIEESAFFGCHNISEIDGNTHKFDLNRSSFGFFGTNKLNLTVKAATFNVLAGNVGFSFENKGSDIKFINCDFNINQDNPTGDKNEISAGIYVYEVGDAVKNVIQFENCDVYIEKQTGFTACFIETQLEHDHYLSFDDECTFEFEEGDVFFSYATGKSQNSDVKLYVYADSSIEDGIYDYFYKNSDALEGSSAYVYANYLVIKDSEYFCSDSGTQAEPRKEFTATTIFELCDYLINYKNCKIDLTLLGDATLTEPDDKQITYQGFNVGKNQEVNIDLNGHQLKFISIGVTGKLTVKNGEMLCEEVDECGISVLPGATFEANNVTVNTLFGYNNKSNVKFASCISGTYTVIINCSLDVGLEEEFNPNLDTSVVNPGDNPGGQSGNNPGQDPQSGTSVSSLSDLKNALIDDEVETIVLAQDIVVDEYLRITRDVEIDLNNHKLSFTNSVGFEIGGDMIKGVCVPHSVKIKNGSLFAADNCGIVVYPNCTLELEDISFIDNCPAVYYFDGATVKLDDSIVTSNSDNILIFEY